jgi:hypothetical protein
MLSNINYCLFLVRCQRCVDNNRLRCYHWSIGDEASLEIFRANLLERLNQYLTVCGCNYEYVKQHSKVIYDPTDLNCTSNRLNIDFIPNGNTEQETSTSLNLFSNFITTELRLRRLSIHGTLEDRRKRLRDFLKVEAQLERIIQAISRGEKGKEAALILISQAIPCVTHLENRVGEKLITVLLALAAEAYQKHHIRSLERLALNIQ